MRPTERSHADSGSLAGLLRAAFGAKHLASVARLAGGSKKGVYRAAFDDGFTAIVYVWSPAEDYWPDTGASGSAADGSSSADPFGHASGLDLFLGAQGRLDALGVRTPRLYLADRGRYYPADTAVLEDVPGPSLEARLDTDPDQALPIVRQLGQALRIMHADKAPGFGKAGHAGTGNTERGGSCAGLVLSRALRHLADASARVPRIGRVRTQLEDTLRRQAGLVAPRAGYSLIHGELGPDHVLVDRAGHPVLIDIEGLLYFDVEWEHVFLDLRFGRHYGILRDAAVADGSLDQARLDLYRLAMHLSLVAGPLRLLDGDWPDRAPMLWIAEYNTERVLALAQPR